MKTIRKKSLVPLPTASGNITDTFNITDKTKNAPSINLIEELERRIYENIYPIGRVIIDENVDAEGNGIDYSNYLGFTWEKTLKGVSPIGINEEDTDEDINFSAMGNSGGEKTHSLTTSQLPKVSGRFGIPPAVVVNDENSDLIYLASGVFSRASVTSGRAYSSSSSASKTFGNLVDFNLGGNEAHNNTHPYKVVAFWKRIA